MEKRVVIGILLVIVEALTIFLELFALLRICDWNSPSIDIIPLFETIPDLESSFEIMKNFIPIKIIFHI